MLLFANCKINLGLDILSKRSDGYHELQSVLIPVARLCDIVEILPSDQAEFRLTGTDAGCPAEENICAKAYRLMRDRYGLPPVYIHLHKNVPVGAGLGGGSSDGAHVICGLNALFGLGLGTQEMERLAAELGSDTAFFIRNRPALATGRGEILEPFEVDLHGKHLVIAKPPVGVSTTEAYRGVSPAVPAVALAERLRGDIRSWRTTVKNDFEPRIFAAHPILGHIKEMLYDAGALYASMSGSGSAVYGIFEHRPEDLVLPPEVFIHHEVIE